MAATQSSAPVLTAADADQLAAALRFAEELILSTIERECEALRTGRLLAAEALRQRLMDTSRLYLNAARAARASLALIHETQPGLAPRFEQGRQIFAALLRIELSVLAAARAAARQDRTPEPPVVAAVAAASDSPRRKSTPRLRPGRSASPTTVRTRSNRADLRS